MKAKKQSLAIKRKSVMRPAVAKPQVEVTVVEKRFGEAPEEKTFALKDGRKLRTVYQLIDELETMNDDIFKEHVNPSKNDFSNWLRDVFDERILADEIKGVQQKMDMQRAILKHIVRVLRK